jgi:hypothetical protein
MYFLLNLSILLSSFLLFCDVAQAWRYFPSSAKSLGGFKLSGDPHFFKHSNSGHAIEYSVHIFMPVSVLNKENLSLNFV